jgi:glutaconate CoA-transferase subunit A
MSIIGLLDAEHRLRNVHSVALGGMLLENRPSALVRSLLRCGANGLFVCSAPAASWDIDVLIGAGRVDTVRIPHISLAGLGLAPATRRAAAAGTVVFEDCDEAILLGGYLAANHHAPIQLLDNLGTNDLVDGNPLVIRANGQTGVAPLRVDVALLHAPLGDAQGNLVHFGSRWADVLMARSAGRVIAQVDRLISTAEAARLGVSIPGYLIDDVVEVPYGAHPLGSVGSYVADLQHLSDYQARVISGGFDDYYRQFCAVDHQTYLQTVPSDVLHELTRAAC